MQKEPGIKWMFLDLNSYFASVEQQENPKLRGKPIAVVPMQTPYTCAIAASYEAKLYGVKTGTIIRDAMRMCPNLTCVLARHDKYVEYHHRVVDEVALHAPINKIWSIDELSSRLPPAKRNPESAQKISENIKAGLRKNVGEAITCSIGFAPNSLLAKIAGNMKKPDGLTILRQEDLPGPLLRLRLIDLPGIGPNMERRLKASGIRSIEDLWNTSPKQARKLWGSVEGERFWYLLHGYDLEKPATKNVMVGHSRVLDPDLRAPVKTRLMGRRLMTKAAYRLRSKNYFARSVILSVRTTEGIRWSGERRIPPAQDPFTLLQELQLLWDEMLHGFFPQNQSEKAIAATNIRFKKISVLLMGLTRTDQINYDLFETSQPAHLLRIKKNESLTRAIDKLQGKYQREMVSFGVPPKTLSGYVGTKIAFSRVPEQEEFWS